MRSLFQRVCEEIQRRELSWRAAKDGETIGFKATPGGVAFKVAMHCALKQQEEFKPPSLLIQPGRPIEDQGEPNPYPELGKPFWVAQYSAQGWTVGAPWRVPDPRPVVDLAIRHGQP